MSMCVYEKNLSTQCQIGGRQIFFFPSKFNLSQFWEALNNGDTSDRIYKKWIIGQYYWAFKPKIFWNITLFCLLCESFHISVVDPSPMHRLGMSSPYNSWLFYSFDRLKHYLMKTSVFGWLHIQLALPCF